MEHDVECQGKSQDEGHVPAQELEKCRHNSVQHGYINVQTKIKFLKSNVSLITSNQLMHLMFAVLVE